MACGCPVLSSTRGALAETVGEAAGRLEPDDAAQMQAQLARAAGDAGWRNQLRAAGYAQARRFNWRDTAAATLGVYARAAGREGEGALPNASNGVKVAPASAVAAMTHHD